MTVGVIIIVTNVKVSWGGGGADWIESSVSFCSQRSHVIYTNHSRFSIHRLQMSLFYDLAFLLSFWQKKPCVCFELTNVDSAPSLPCHAFLNNAVSQARSFFQQSLVAKKEDTIRCFIPTKEEFTINRYWLILD